MKRGHAATMVLLAGVFPWPASASDTWVVRNIARHAGISTDEVIAVLGDRMALTECQYNLHPSRRGEIRRLVIEGRDAMIAAQTGHRSPATPVSAVIAALDRQDTLREG